MRRLGRLVAALALLLAAALTMITAPNATAAPKAAAAPRLSHVFLIMEENNGFHDIIGNKAAPNLNYLAKTFGLETDYFGVSPCCSESNYVQLLGGKSFPSVQSDDAYWKNTVRNAPSLITQLDRAGISWKAYLQSRNDVWAVGARQGGNGIFGTLAEHWNGHRWTVTRTPDPGTAGDQLYAVSAVSKDDVWAVGQRLDGAFPDQALVEHWNGVRWSVVSLPASVSSNALLDGVTATRGGQVWVAGEADSPAGGGRPLIEHYAGGHWSVQKLPALPDGANWSNLYGVAAGQGSVWAAGTYVDPATDNNNALVYRDAGGKWTISDFPSPGGSGGSGILGGVTAVGGHLWMAGTYTTATSSRLPLIARR